MNEIVYSIEDETYYFLCPWCEMMTSVHNTEIRCTIFRHANFKDFSFVPPHASEDVCKSWLKDGIVWGCTKPFIFDGKTVKKCDYI